jgi:hypothetical protein
MQKCEEITGMKTLGRLDKGNSSIESVRGYKWAVVNLTAVEETDVPLWRELRSSITCCARPGLTTDRLPICCILKTVLSTEKHVVAL